MSHGFALQAKTIEIKKKISKEFSEYSKSLRKQLTTITDYEAEFDKVFGNFVEGKLPKDELYYNIKAEFDKKDEPKSKDALENIKDGKKLLPKMHANVAEEIAHEQHQTSVQKELKAIQERGPKGKNNLLIPELQGEF